LAAAIAALALGATLSAQAAYWSKDGNLGGGATASTTTSGASVVISATEGAPFSGVVDTVALGQASCPATIDWGDGSTSTVTPDGRTGDVTGSHIYAEEGSYAGTVTTSTNNGEVCTNPDFVDSFSATVADAALSSTGTQVSATAGSSFSGVVASFTDADPAGTVSDYVATVDWGDGQSSSGTVTAASSGGFQVTASHTYTAPGSFSVTVSIRDTGGASTIASTTASVAAAPPSARPPSSTARPVLSGSSVVGLKLSCSQGSWSGTLPITYAYQWLRDGVTIASATSSTYTLAAADGGHALACSVSATNGAGSASAMSTPVSVAFPPVAGVTGNVTVLQGTVLIRAPHSGAAQIARASGAGGWVAPLKGVTVAVPIGSTIDARKGRLVLATAADYLGSLNRHHRLQNATLSAAMFTIEQLTARQQLARQKRHRKRLPVGIPATSLVLTNPPNASVLAHCHRTGAPGKGVVRSLHGVAKGLYETVGAASTTTVRNAIWNVVDRCDGTLTEVGRGQAKVGFVGHGHKRTVTVHAGQAFFVGGRFLAAKGVLRWLRVG
jgi:hypothetical protein